MRGGALEGGQLPIFVNFQWSNLAGRGFVLPKGGAMIHVVAQSELSGRHRGFTLDEWANFDQHRGDQGKIARRVLQMPKSTEVGRALMLAFDDTVWDVSSEQHQRCVIVYWEFLGERFATQLRYEVGDPHSSEYENLLVSLMRGVRPIMTSRGRSDKR